VSTAAHCIGSDDEAKATKFVFDFKMKDKDNAQSTFNDDEVFIGKRILQSHSSYTQDDWELIELDHDVTDQGRIADIRRDGLLYQTHKVFAIGYPSGLPVKVSAGGNVRHNVDPKIFLFTLPVPGALCSMNSILWRASSQGEIRIFCPWEIVPRRTIVPMWAVRGTR